MSRLLHGESGGKCCLNKDPFGCAAILMAAFNLALGVMQRGILYLLATVLSESGDGMSFVDGVLPVRTGGGGGVCAAGDAADKGGDGAGRHSADEGPRCGAVLRAASAQACAQAHPPPHPAAARRAVGLLHHRCALPGLQQGRGSFVCAKRLVSYVSISQSNLLQPVLFCPARAATGLLRNSRSCSPVFHLS
jgi:hypothetical protein